MGDLINLSKEMIMTAITKTIINICKKHQKVKRYGRWLYMYDFLKDLRYYEYESIIVEAECDECLKENIL